ncbi:hypothetical protein MN116_008426, partial [Schistosoma mekongi]
FDYVTMFLLLILLGVLIEYVNMSNLKSNQPTLQKVHTNTTVQSSVAIPTVEEIEEEEVFYDWWLVYSCHIQTI